jgi:RNA polymerase sigma-70 factor (ECF subfamily)
LRRKSGREVAFDQVSDETNLWAWRCWDYAETPEKLFMRQETKRLVERAVLRLPSAPRENIALRANEQHISDNTFDDWVRQYQRFLFGIAYWWTGSRTDAEELTQEAFFQAYRSRSSLREIEAVKGWLVGILRHCYGQMHRKGHSRVEVSVDEAADQFAETMDLQSAGADQHELLALHQALERLDDKHRLPLVLFYFHELSYREIAEALELPLGTVMSRLFRARQLMHECLTRPAELIVVKKTRKVNKV